MPAEANARAPVGTPTRWGPELGGRVLTWTSITDRCSHGRWEAADLGNAAARGSSEVAASIARPGKAVAPAPNPYGSDGGGS